VNETGAGVAGDEFGRMELAGAIAERMLVLKLGQLFGGKGLFGVAAPAALLRNDGQQAAK